MTNNVIFYHYDRWVHTICDDFYINSMTVLEVCHETWAQTPARMDH